jgi:hypothetical protein
MGFQIKAWVIFGHSQLVYFAAFVKVLGLFSGYYFASTFQKDLHDKQRYFSYYCLRKNA